MLQTAIENEVVEYVEIHEHIQDEYRYRKVVHNGHLTQRELIMGSA